MIVFDIETSGLDFNKHGIWQIGAVELGNPENTFLEEARIDDTDAVDSEALLVTGKTEAELRDTGKQSQKQLLQNFFQWCENIEVKNCICQGPQWDLGFIWAKSCKYGIKEGVDFPLHHRAFDLHSIASLKYKEVNGKFLIKDDKSQMGLSNILPFVGMEDKRGDHNALEDAKLTAESFSRIVYGKNLIKEFASYPVPEYLQKQGGEDDYIQ
jgi:DNA polymerase III epsilon subunit-like protein